MEPTRIEDESGVGATKTVVRDGGQLEVLTSAVATKRMTARAS